MMLENVHIVAFGKLHDIDFDFKDSVNTICQQNGYGKTTLTIFIKAMFYGMAQTGRNKAFSKERSKFQPWDNGNYGGSITFVVDNKKYLMTRTFGKTPESDTFELIDLKTRLKSNDYSKNIGEEIFGVGVETFEISAFFPQNNLVSGVNDEVRANLTGVNKFDCDLASVSQATKNIAAKMTALRSSCPKQNELDSLKANIENGQAKFQTMQTDIEELTHKIKGHENSLKESDAKLKQVKSQISESAKLKDYYQQQTLELKSSTLARDKLFDQKSIIQAALSQKSSRKEKSKLILFILGFVLITLTVVSSIIAGFLQNLRILFITLAAVFLVSSMLTFFLAFNLQSKKDNHSTPTYHMNDYLEIEKEIDKLNIAINGYEEILSTMPQIENEENLTKLQEEFYLLDKDLSILKLEKRNLESEYQKLDKYILEKQDEYEKLFMARQEVTSSLNLLEKTKQYLLKAKENVSTRFIEPMQENFDKLLGKIISEKLQMDIDLNINKMTDAGLKESEYFSQGYQDIISICKRFALLEKVYLKKKPFIILDDPFVNLDDEKLALAKKLVLEFGEKYQIIYICSHSRLII